MVGGDGGQEILQGVAVGGIAGGDADGGAGGLELLLQEGGAGSVGTLAREQQQVADAVVLDEMASEP